MTKLLNYIIVAALLTIASCGSNLPEETSSKIINIFGNTNEAIRIGNPEEPNPESDQLKLRDHAWIKPDFDDDNSPISTDGADEKAEKDSKADSSDAASDVALLAPDKDSSSTDDKVTKEDLTGDEETKNNSGVDCFMMAGPKGSKLDADADVSASSGNHQLPGGITWQELHQFLYSR